MQEIKRVAVLGSGVMGGAIAALVANCGIPCLMLDIVPPNLSDADRQKKDKRDAFAAASKAALLKAKPSPIYSKEVVDLIEIGNFDDDFARINDCDWICEVVKEDLAIKKAVFEKVNKHRAPGSIVSTNTSGVLISSMVDPMDDDMRKHFIGTHFFNPPRYLKLLEIIPGPDTLPEVVAFTADFMENVLGKGIVYAKDTSNFVANRILTFSMAYTLHKMTEAGLTFEEVDALTGPVIGHASSATFRTADLVGMDTFVHVVGNVYNGCPDDEAHDTMKLPEWVDKMIAKGLFGDKSGSGFFKKTNEKDEKGKKIILSLDPNTLEYKAQVKPRFDCIGAARNASSVADKVKIMATGEDKGAKSVWDGFANMAVYAGNRIPEIADDIVQIDNAVKWGFAWEIGIFETWDILGFNYVCDRMKADGLKLPPIANAMIAAGADCFYKEQGGKQMFFDLASKAYKAVPTNPNVFVLADLKKAGKVVSENDDASLIDLGDGIVNCEFHCKMNVVGPDLCKVLYEGVTMLNEGKFEGMVVANQGPHFSAGANLMVVLGYIMNNDWEALRKMITEFQAVNMAMRYCSRPVVSAPHHYTFGGGVEVSQHAARAVIAGETYAGLVEAGVGVIPAGGGTKEMLRRAQQYLPAGIIDPNPAPYLRRAFESIAMAKVGTSARECIELGYYNPWDVICVNIDQQVKRAKDVCRGLVVGGYKAPGKAVLTAYGEPARAMFRAALYNMQLGGFASEHDATIAMHVANILTGGDRAPGTKMTEQDVLDLECEAFLSLCGTEKTQDRIRQMLTSGKPLRN